MTSCGFQTFITEHFKPVKIQTVVLKTMKRHLYRKPQTSLTTSSKLRERKGRVGVGKGEDCSPGMASSCALRVNTGVSVLTSQQNTLPFSVLTCTQINKIMINYKNFKILLRDLNIKIEEAK